jgi:hypothetical protein
MKEVLLPSFKIISHIYLGTGVSKRNLVCRYIRIKKAVTPILKRSNFFHNKVGARFFLLD